MTQPGPPDASPRGPQRFRPQLPTREPRPKRFPFTGLAVAAGLVTMGMYAWGWLISTSAVGVALVEIPLLLLLSLPIFIRASREEPRFDLGGLLALGLVVRFAATYYRFTHASDGSVYHFWGEQLARGYRNLDFSADPSAPVPGTGGLRVISGLVEVVTNGNSFATFLVFAWLGFLGCYFFYRAFTIALPDADRLRYALLIMLWPTMVFWPSSIGKDCWLLFTLGIASLGAAKVFARRPGGYTLLLVGLLLGSFVRPHVSLMLADRVRCGAPRRPPRRTTRRAHPDRGGQGRRTDHAAGDRRLSRHEDRRPAQHRRHQRQVDTVLDAELRAAPARVAPRSLPPTPRTPLGYVEATVTILFRPFVFEAQRHRGARDFARGARTARAHGGVLAKTRRDPAAVAGRSLRDPRSLLRAHLLLRVRHDRELRHPGARAIAAHAVRLRAPLVAGARASHVRHPRGTEAGPAGSPAPRLMGEVAASRAAIAAYGLPTSARRSPTERIATTRLRECSTERRGERVLGLLGSAVGAGAFPVTDEQRGNGRVEPASPGRCTVCGSSRRCCGRATCSTAPGFRCGS